MAKDITAQKRSEVRLKLQLAVTQILAEAGSIERIYGQILEKVGDALPWDGGGWWNADRAARLLRCADSWGRPEYEELISTIRQFTFEQGQSLPGRVWASGRAEWIRELTDDMFPVIRVSSAVAVPIRVRDDIVSVLAFFSAEPHDPDNEMVATLSLHAFVEALPAAHRDLISARNKTEFDAAFAAIVLEAVQRLENGSKYYSNDNEDNLSHTFVGFVNGTNALTVTREEFSNGHVDMTFRAPLCRPARLVLGEAKIFDYYSWHEKGLFTTYRALLDRARGSRLVAGV